MKSFGRLFVAVGAMSLLGAAYAADGTYTWQWNPGMHLQGAYSDNFTGYMDQSNTNTWMTPGSYLYHSQLGAAGANLGANSVAVVIDPAYLGYDFVGFNCTITGIYLVDVNGGAFSGASWVTTQQVGSLYHYASTGFGGASVAFTAGPGSLAFAAAPDSDGNASMGVFNPTVSNVSVAPILTAVNPNNPFGVTITGIPVPEPTSLAAIGIGLAILAARRRRR